MKLIFLVSLLFAGDLARAACAGPSGIAGQFQWSATNSEMEFCNGTNWISSYVATTATACTIAGRVAYSSSPVDLQYCDGSFIKSMTSNLTDGSCSGTATGTFHYNIVNNYEEWCDGSTWWVMYAQPSLKLDFSTGILSPSVQFYRAGGAGTFAGFYYNSSGTLTLPPQNFVVSSQVFSVAPWSNNDVTITANAVTAPDGTLTASKIVEAADGGTANYHYPAAYNIALPTANVAYTCSAYLKAGERTATGITFQNPAGTNALHATINLTAGTITAAGLTGASTGGSTSITSVGSGWYRVSISGIIDTTSTTATCYMLMQNAATQSSYAGDGTSGMYMWGMQIEKGSAATSYIYTNGTTAYGPRFDYDPVALTLNGLLIEESRINHLTNSQNLASGYSKNNVTTTSNQASPLAPDATATGNLVTESSDGGVATNHYLNQTYTGSVAQRWTFSFYVYPINRSQVSLLIADNGATVNQVNAIFTLTGAGTSAVANGGNATGAVASIQALANGWYRCTISGAPNTSGTVVRAQVGLLVSGAGSYIGTGATAVYLWGGQLEAGYPASSYIPTTTGDVTRNADNATINDATLMSGTEGSLLVNAVSANLYYNTNASASIGAPNIAASLEADLSDRLQIRRSGGTNTTVDGVNNAIYYSAGTTILSFAGSNNSWPLLTSEYYGVAYKSGSYSIVTNGTVQATASGTSLFTPTQLALGHSVYYGNFWNGWLKNVNLYKSRLPDNRLQQLTSGIP